MNITPTTIAFCEALFRLQKRITPEILKSEAFETVFEPFAIAPYEFGDIKPALGYSGELAVMPDRDNQELYRISIRVIGENTGRIYSTTTDTAFTGEILLQVLSGGLNPDASVATVKRILGSIPELAK